MDNSIQKKLRELVEMLSKHNPNYRLVSKYVRDYDKTIELVYGVSNEGSNEGLEAYFHRPSEMGHYRSYRWETDKIPKKYQDDFKQLKSELGSCPEGHKLNLNSRN